MADVIKTLQKNKSYPWDRWGDGEPRRAKRGKDFDCKANSFVAAIHYAANEIVKRKVTTHIIDDNTVEFQFNRPRKRA